MCASKWQLDTNLFQNVIVLVVLVIIIMRVCDLMPGLF